MPNHSSLSLLKQTTNLQMLLTTREQLHMQAEQILWLDGLAYPTKTAVSTITSSSSAKIVSDHVSFPAMKLLQHRIRRTQTDLQSSQDDITHMQTICRLLEGMPLAIELAAAWTNTLPLSAIVDELTQGFALLETELHDVAERHRRITAVFDHTWQKLNPTEQQLFAKLCLFGSNFSRKAAQAITEASLKQLASLTQKTLLRPNQTKNRYSIHELLRQYGQQKAQTLPEIDIDDLAEQHSRYYCRALQGRNTPLKGAQQQKTIAAIHTDMPNVRIAWEWACQEINVKRIHDTQDSLGHFCLNSGRFRLGINLFEMAAKSCAKVAGIDQETLVICLGWQAMFRRQMGDIVTS